MAAFTWLSHAGGMNMSAVNRRVAIEDEPFFLSNATVRRGWAETRPAIRRLETLWSSDAQAIFEHGRMQGAQFYRSLHGDFMVYAVDGELLIYDLQTRLMEKVALDKRPFSAESPFVWFCQRGNHFIAQDGVSPPVVLNGKLAEQGTEPRKEVPTGKMMANGWGRLAVVAPNRRWIYFGNHEADPLADDDLAFTEDTAYYLNTRFFEVSSSLGLIVGIAFAPSLNGGSDLGPLTVFCENGVVAYDISLPRETWAETDITNTLFDTIGACAHAAIVPRGNDLLFSDQHGRIQTIRNAISRQEDASIAITDRNVWPLYEKEDGSLRRHRMSVRFGERILTTVQPQRYRINRGRFAVRHLGMVILQETPIVQRNPVWDGVWTGVQPTSLATATVGGVERCLIASLDDDGIQRLYELTTDAEDDFGTSRSPIPMIVGLQGSDLDQPFLPKPHKSCVARLGGLRGTVNVRGFWQPDRGSVQPWFSAVEIAGSAILASCADGLSFAQEQPRPRLNLPAPPKDASIYYEAAPWLEITGRARLEEVTLEASEPTSNPDSVNVSCRKPASPAAYGCPPSPFNYRIHAPAS
jgi:hypothetical protein